MKLGSDFFISTQGLEQIEARSFEIVFEQFESMSKSDDVRVKEFIHTLGKEEFYESLKYEFNVVFSLIYTGNVELVRDFFIWKYSVYTHRGFDCDFFLYAFDFWQDVFFKNLHKSHAAMLNLLYAHLKDMHQEFLQNAKQIPPLPTNEQYPALVDELALYLLHGKESEGAKLIEKTLCEFRDIYAYADAIIAPIMQRVGILWQTNQISVAKEHLATATLDAILQKFMKKSARKKQKRAVVSIVGDELHIFGIKLVAQYLKTKGYEVFNLGLDNSPSDICEQVKTIKPDIVVLSITLHSNVAALQKAVNMLKNVKEFTGKIIVGGQGLYQKKSIAIKAVDAQCATLEELKEFLR
jgi:methanogenic corrinoid protein MtbC1